MICLTVFNNFPGKAGLEQLLVVKVSYKCVSLWVPAFHLSLPVSDTEAQGDPSERGARSLSDHLVHLKELRSRDVSWVPAQDCLGG